MRMFKAIVAVCLGATLLAGCAGYRVGPTGGAVAGDKSIEVKFFQNKTVEPRLGDALTSALRKKLQQDGTYALSTRGEPDIVVTGVITHYERSGLSYQPQDILTVRDYTIRIFAKITATEKSSGKVLYEGEVTGRTFVRVGNDLVSAERQSLPVLAADFARNAASLLTEGAW